MALQYISFTLIQNLHNEPALAGPFNDAEGLMALRCVFPRVVRWNSTRLGTTVCHGTCHPKSRMAVHHLSYYVYLTNMLKYPFRHYLLSP
jgi:hypothetical protein